MVRMVRCLDEIKEEFEHLSFLVDGQNETAGSLLATGRWFKCILSLESPRGGELEWAFYAGFLWQTTPPLPRFPSYLEESSMPHKYDEKQL